MNGCPFWSFHIMSKYYKIFLKQSIAKLKYLIIFVNPIHLNINMLLLGIDVGTSSVKVSVIDAQSGKIIANKQYPDAESEIISSKYGWAEQSPDMWWEHVKKAILLCNQQQKYNSQDIGAIGIAYQMHGLVLVDEHQNSLRNSIIWCDSRAVEIGDKAFENIGSDYCLSHLYKFAGKLYRIKISMGKRK